MSGHQRVGWPDPWHCGTPTRSGRGSTFGGELAVACRGAIGRRADAQVHAGVGPMQARPGRARLGRHANTSTRTHARARPGCIRVVFRWECSLCLRFRKSSLLFSLRYRTNLLMQVAMVCNLISFMFIQSFDNAFLTRANPYSSAKQSQKPYFMTFHIARLIDMAHLRPKAPCTAPISALAIPAVHVAR